MVYECKGVRTVARWLKNANFEVSDYYIRYNPILQKAVLIAYPKYLKQKVTEIPMYQWCFKVEKPMKEKEIKMAIAYELGVNIKGTNIWSEFQ